MVQTFEFFKKEFEFRGKHAEMVSQLWKKDDYEGSFFKRLVDIYVMAAVIGFRIGRKAEEDHSIVAPRSIYPEQMNKEKENLDFIMQMILLLDNPSEESDEAINRAFRGVDSREKYDAYYKLFNDYVRGGVEELYELLIIRQRDIDDECYDDKSANILGLIEKFS